MNNASTNITYDLQKEAIKALKLWNGLIIGSIAVTAIGLVGGLVAVPVYNKIRDNKARKDLDKTSNDTSNSDD